MLDNKQNAFYTGDFLCSAFWENEPFSRVLDTDFENSPFLRENGVIYTLNT